MIRILGIFNNGISDYFKIYSDSYLKIKNKKNNNLYSTTEESPLAVLGSEIHNFEETDIRIIIDEDDE